MRAFLTLFSVLVALSTLIAPAKSVMAATHTLTVSVSPAGGGSVGSWPYGISCPDDCIHDFDETVEVNLTADYSPGYQFDHWEGDAGGTDASIQLFLNSDKTVTAVFIPVQNPQTLSVNVLPTGGGSVGSWPEGISCPSDCTEQYPFDAEVYLTANYAPGFQFDHWEGDAEGTDPQYLITMGGNKSVQAVFIPVQNPQTLNVSISPENGGTVGSYPTGIECPGDCTEQYPLNASVVLTANFNDGFQFDRWEQDGSGSEASLTVTMNTHKNVTAVFTSAIDPQTLTVSILPPGAGSVGSIPTGIACPTDCVHDFPLNTSVSLTANYNNGYVFDHWEGGSGGSSRTINITMDTDKNVTAVFASTEDTRQLTVQISPIGAGSVSSIPTGIACPTDCIYDYPLYALVNLRATAGADYRFDHWAGLVNVYSPNLALTMDADKTIIAYFYRIKKPVGGAGYLILLD